MEDGEYYLLGTTGNDCWDKGSDLTLYSSKDLVCFERVGCMVGKDALADYTQIWAPELHKYCGKYYLIVSVFQKSKGRGSIILVSDTLKEKFQPLTGDVYKRQISDFYSARSEGASHKRRYSYRPRQRE